MKIHCRTAQASLLAILIAGCGGGGGSDDPAVAAPADSTATTTPPTGPSTTQPSAPVVAPPTAAAPVAAPTPAPTPSPARSPAQPAPVAPPPADPPNALDPRLDFVDRMALSRAMGDLITGPVGPGTVATADDGTRVYARQNWRYTPDSPGSYFHTHVAIDHALPALLIQIQTRPETAGRIGEDMLVNEVVALTRILDLEQSTAPVPVSSALQTWGNQDGARVWFDVRRAPSTENFRLCWNVRLPALQRTSCTTHDRTTGLFAGGVLVTDGGRTWGVQ